MSSKKIAGFAAFLIIGFSSLSFGADNLEGALKESGWDKLVGTWGDGSGAVSTFEWKFPGTVIESTTKMGDTERVSLIWRNAKTGVISVVSADNKGGSSKGDCEFSTGKAVFKITSASPDGTEANMVIHYILDGDNLEVKVEGKGDGAKLKRQ